MMLSTPEFTLRIYEHLTGKVRSSKNFSASLLLLLKPVLSVCLSVCLSVRLSVCHIYEPLLRVSGYRYTVHTV